jgi:glutamate N-acetyltransferase / amino-acid N-acetyltransferase
MTQINADKINIILEGTVTSAKGFQAAAVAANIKYKDRLDLMLIHSDADCAATAVFTKNQVVAAPVIVDQDTLALNKTTIRAIVANAGIANACTGLQGLKNAQKMQQLAADALGCESDQVLVLSTGVIGMQLPMNKMAAGIETAVPHLSAENGRLAAQAIMTTDTHPKHGAIQIELAEGSVTIGGMAKGAGMIHPNMATMLGVITTDAIVEPDRLRMMLKTAVNASFNRISIDGDSSTNDTVLLLANGASGIGITRNESAVLFQNGLNQLCKTLAHAIVRDGEGATKFVELIVTGAKTDADAHAITQTIATSPLVKTAFAGSDPNWGRILAAAGRAGIKFDQYQTSLTIGIESPTDLQLVANGTPTTYQEVDAAHIFAQPAFIIQLDIGQGDASDTMWTSDLTQEYVTINADYRT